MADRAWRSLAVTVRGKDGIERPDGGLPRVASVLASSTSGSRAPAGALSDREEAETMTASSEICRMDTVGLARRIAARELSPVEVVDAVLDRLDRLDPVLHMFT